MLHINDLTYRVGGRTLFEGATVAIPAGHRVGLIGRNGSGKSTLLRLIAGELQPDGGRLSVQPGARVGQVAQEAPDGPDSLLDTVLAADRERAALLAEAEHATDPARIAEIHTRLADIAAHDAPARAARILAGLGFDQAAQQRPCAEFSGGWRMRVALAAALFARPDLLLLDEPSNHLDLEARLWLEGFLKTYPYTIILVSHDRDLLNATAQQIVHVENGKLVLYAGNYDRYERTRRERLERLAAMQSRQLAERRHIQSFIDRFRYKASKARQAQSRIKMLERMEPVVAIAEEEGIDFAFPAPPQLSPPIINLEDVSVGYEPGRPVLSRLNLRLDMDDRVALLGANGNGKSTLIRLLSDRLKPLSGSVRRSAKLRVGYFAQHQAEELDLSLTPLQQLARRAPQVPEQKLRTHLGGFNFSGDRAQTEIGRMSGGEKTRLLFALMSWDAPHILLLDEPTNHLDMDARAALIEALNAYEGAVVLVSHDTHLLRLVADRLWLVADGTCTSFEGDLEDYERLLLGASGGTDGSREERAAGGARKDQRRQNAELRARLAPLRKAAAEAERRVASLQEKRRQVEAALADPKLYEGPADRVRTLQIENAELQRQIEAAEAAWFEAQEALEAAEAEMAA